MLVLVIVPRAEIKFCSLSKSSSSWEGVSCVLFFCFANILERGETLYIAKHRGWSSRLERIIASRVESISRGVSFLQCSCFIFHGSWSLCGRSMVSFASEACLHHLEIRVSGESGRDVE